jgi:TonB family protein
MKKTLLLILVLTAPMWGAEKIYEANFQLYVGAYESEQAGHVIISLPPGQFTPMMGLGLVEDLQKTFHLKEMKLISAPKVQIQENRAATIRQGVQGVGKLVPFDSFTLKLTPISSEGETVHIRFSVAIEDKPATTMEFVTRQDTPVTLANRLNGHILFVICTIEERDCKTSRPELLTKTDPVYPPEMKAAGVSGTVILEVKIDADGKPADVKVVQSPAPELAQAAVDAVKQWKWKPAVMNGKAVAVVSNITVRFALH